LRKRANQRDYYYYHYYFSAIHCSAVKVKERCSRELVQQLDGLAQREKRGERVREAGMPAAALQGQSVSLCFASRAV
jgi:hypothetical protein